MNKCCLRFYYVCRGFIHYNLANKIVIIFEHTNKLIFLSLIQSFRGENVIYTSENVRFTEAQGGEFVLNLTNIFFTKGCLKRYSERVVRYINVFQDCEVQNRICW